MISALLLALALSCIFIFISVVGLGLVFDLYYNPPDWLLKLVLIGQLLVLASVALRLVGL